MESSDVKTKLEDVLIWQINEYKVALAKAHEDNKSLKQALTDAIKILNQSQGPYDDFNMDENDWLIFQKIKESFKNKKQVI